MRENEQAIAEVISVFPDKVRISINDIEAFSQREAIKVGSYLTISDNEDCALIAIIQNFSLSSDENTSGNYILEALPLGVIREGKFIRGGDALTIPPRSVEPTSLADVKKIFEESIKEERKFTFCSLNSNPDIRVPVDGNKFFNKHIAVIGSTGSGKSHSIAKIVQQAVSEKNGQYTLNNSHVIIFDLHSEYKAAFPDANVLDINNLCLPYWLLNSEELEEILLDTGERDNYNQSSVFRTLVTENKRKHNSEKKSIFYDSPLKFDLQEVLNALYNIKNETVNAKNSSRLMIISEENLLKDEKIVPESGVLLSFEERLNLYFKERHSFHPTKRENITKGIYAEGTLDKFFIRFESKIAQERLKFLFSESSMDETLESVLERLMSYGKNKSNVTIIDLSGIPFEVLNITVSLISRILFEYGYYYKALRNGVKHNSSNDNETPLLLVYEEAHKYVPKSDLTKFRASKLSIERIAKEGRKYGVTLLLSSQRPSEISETIFSQCNSFIAMRLTNPTDQHYVSRLLPDTLGNLSDKLPTLEAGEGLLIGDSVVMPSLIKIDECPEERRPSSNDIPYLEIWKEEWKEIRFEEIKKAWTNE